MEVRRENTVPVFATTRFATQVSPDPADRFLASASRPLAKKQRKDALYFARKAGVNLVWAKNTTGTKPKPDAQRPAAQVYFYHPDHLGTATLLTDINGQPYQYFLNLPFGEEMAAQRAGGPFSSRYKFNGKELDKQTGYYYYGARYYDPVLSRWLSVDPLAEIYYELSPYNFTANNPINALDIDGRYIYILGRNGKLLKLYNLVAHTDIGQKVIDEFINNPDKHIFITVADTRNAHAGGGTFHIRRIKSLPFSKEEADYYVSSLGNEWKDFFYRFIGVHLLKGDNYLITLDLIHYNPNDPYMLEAAFHEIYAHAYLEAIGESYDGTEQHRILAGTNSGRRKHIRSSDNSQNKLYPIEVFFNQYRNIKRHEKWFYNMQLLEFYNNKSEKIKYKGDDFFE